MTFFLVDIDKNGGGLEEAGFKSVHFWLRLSPIQICNNFTSFYCWFFKLISWRVYASMSKTDDFNSKHGRFKKAQEIQQLSRGELHNGKTTATQRRYHKAAVCKANIGFVLCRNGTCKATDLELDILNWSFVY
ncbi:hypothetical protein FRX31_023346 [Thalictrum thalictroides]|uniref:Uncharacterized protein n=1 Tax=Thalictrum thalictroides TaxID=46969 RepID=A0A7J6VPQ0_THATH|nr:hypothetical protein FRX31_023346 [Thalictrum thalictroides]